MASDTAPTRRSGAERALPLGYIAMAIALGALLLPSVLRPPQDTQSTTAAFSGDAPPDDQPQEPLIQSVEGAQSPTAGAAVTTSTQPPQEVIYEETVITAPTTTIKKQASLGGCHPGDPPRQTESLYSHKCVPAWTGTDNGGATHRGVTKDEIRVGIQVALDSAVPEGQLDRDFSPTDDSDTRLLKVWQTYFNQKFEFYGRYLQFYVFKMSTTNDDSAREVADTADDRHGGMFAFILDVGQSNAAVNNKLAELGIISFAFDTNPVEWYRDNHPFVYGFDMDSWQQRRIGSQLVCEQWAHKQPGSLNGNQPIHPTIPMDEDRVFGLIVYQDELRTGAIEMYKEGLSECNVELAETASYNLNDEASSIAGTVQKMLVAGVTTILAAVDPLTPGVLTDEAQSSQYFPEWVCLNGCETNTVGRLLTDEQAEHFVALATGEIPRVDADKDWYRAYKEIDPDGVPDSTYFRHLQQLSGGIQHADTNLTPEAFWTGLKDQPCRTPDPVWSMGGCYTDPDPSSPVHYLGDYSYVDYASLLWFDNAGQDPNSSTTGAWCWMNDGARFGLDAIPTGELPFRDESQCYFSPPRGEQG